MCDTSVRVASFSGLGVFAAACHRCLRRLPAVPSNREKAERLLQEFVAQLNETRMDEDGVAIRRLLTLCHGFAAKLAELDRPKAAKVRPKHAVLDPFLVSVRQASVTAHGKKKVSSPSGSIVQSSPVRGPCGLPRSC